jgi:hypothetical protein
MLKANAKTLSPKKIFRTFIFLLRTAAPLYLHFAYLKGRIFKPSKDKNNVAEFESAKKNGQFSFLKKKGFFFSPIFFHTQKIVWKCEIRQIHNRQDIEWEDERTSASGSFGYVSL